MLVVFLDHICAFFYGVQKIKSFLLNILLTQVKYTEEARQQKILDIWKSHCCT